MLQFHSIYNDLATFAERLMVRAQQEQQALAQFYDAFRLQVDLHKSFNSRRMKNRLYLPKSLRRYAKKRNCAPCYMLLIMPTVLADRSLP
jgi:hypothetical protein